MSNYCLIKQISLLLLLVFVTPGYGQADGFFFRNGIRDKAGNLWFATSGMGVYRYDAATGVLSNLTEIDGLCANSVHNILEDKSGILWFSTANGVCSYDGKLFKDFTAIEGNWKNHVTCILEDKTGNFWFGTNGYGVWRYDTASGEFVNYTKDHRMGSDAVQCILEDKSGNLWFGERAGGVCRYDSVTDSFTKVDDGGCFSSQIMSIIEDRNGDIWFANLYNGLCRYNPKTSDFTHFTEDDGIFGNVITCIYEDKKGDLWFSSGTNKSGIINVENRGLSRYDGKSFTLFSEKDGLSNMEILFVVEDLDENIWVGTKGNLYRHHATSGKFIDYTYKLDR